MENILAGSLVTQYSSRGLLVLMKYGVFDKLVLTTHYQSGRILRIRFQSNNKTFFNLVAVYGVNSLVSTAPKRKIIANVHHTVCSIYRTYTEECIIVAGHLNTVSRD